jgi:hypothetical protein
MFSSSTNHNYNPISINENETCGNNDNGSGNDYVDRQMRHQQLEMRRQDEGLEMLSESASRLGTLSLGISEELGHQNRYVLCMLWDDDLLIAMVNLCFFL